MRIFQNITETFRAAWTDRVNYHARHALVMLLISFGCIVAAGVFLAEKEVFPALLLLSTGIVCFGLWCYLLPDALWRAHIQRVLREAKRKQRR